MKVLGINGSSRKNGNTAIIMKIVFAELEQNGIETELIQLGNDVISPCRGCFSCTEKAIAFFKKICSVTILGKW